MRKSEVNRPIEWKLSKENTILVKFFNENRKYSTLRALQEITGIDHPQKVVNSLQWLVKKWYIIETGEKSYKSIAGDSEYTPKSEIYRLRIIEKKYKMLLNTYNNHISSLEDFLSKSRRRVDVDLP